MSLKVVNWDLDGTIGYFFLKNRKINGNLRNSIEEVLLEFQKKELKQVITTAAEKDYAEKVLDYFNITQYFETIFCSNNVGVAIGEKDYTHVIDYFNINRDEAPENMVIIGNSNDDHPSSLNEMVLIQLPEEDNRDATIIQEIVFNLLPNFKTSFQQWFTNGVPKLRNEIQLEKSQIYKTEKQTYLIKLI